MRKWGGPSIHGGGQESSAGADLEGRLTEKGRGHWDCAGLKLTQDSRDFLPPIPHAIKHQEVTNNCRLSLEKGQVHGERAFQSCRGTGKT